MKRGCGASSTIIVFDKNMTVEEMEIILATRDFSETPKVPSDPCILIGKE